MYVLQAARGAVRLGDEAVRIEAMLPGCRVGVHKGRTGSAERLQNEEAGDCQLQKELKKSSHGPDCPGQG